MTIAERVQVLIDLHPCPTCRFKGSFYEYGQSAICGRCPVVVCTYFDGEYEDENGGKHQYSMCLVRPEDFRPDWLEDWEEFFKTGKVPELHLEKEEENDERRTEEDVADSQNSDRSE